MNPSQQKPPIVFISYSWTSSEHVERVLHIATYLRENGVDARIDRWNLREGQDANEFMESMVAEGGADKVILMCDRTYSEKADGRVGGVGTEVQIITPELYRQKETTKYLAVVTEFDDFGQAYLPVFYGSRIYIDVSDETRDAESFERILRWIFGSPSDVAPEIGAKPRFLDDNVKISTAGSKLTRAKKSLRLGLASLEFDVDDAIDAILKSVDELGTGFDNDDPVQDFHDSLHSITDIREETLDLFEGLVVNGDNKILSRIIETFFENLYSISIPGQSNPFRQWDRDRQKFFSQEIIIYIAALMIKKKRYEEFASFANREFFLDGFRKTGKVAGFQEFQQPLMILEHSNKNRSSKRVSVFTDLMKERSEVSRFKFKELQQAELMLFLVSSHNYRQTGLRYWYPFSLIYMDYSEKFPIIEKAKTENGQRDILSLTGIQSMNDLKNAFKNRNGELIKTPGFYGDTILEVVGAEKLPG